MKANEAPEKIYRTTTYLDNDNGKTLWKKAPVAGAENIEYTRTDAFIEKAKKWFERQNEWHDINGNRHCDMEDFEDFKKEMGL